MGLQQPAFIVKSPKGDAVHSWVFLFLRWNASLDLKTPLLRSLDAVEGEALKLLLLLGEHETQSVCLTIGAEQEVLSLGSPTGTAAPRWPNFCGRTLIGAQLNGDQN